MSRMFGFVLLCLAAAVYTTSSQQVNAWKTGSSYIYQVELRTLTQAGIWSGRHYKGQLTLQSNSDDILTGMLNQMSSARIGNVDLPVYRPVPSIERPFEVMMEDGAMTRLRVPRRLDVWKENLLKAFIGPFQYGISERQNSSGWGEYHKMENDITGKCEVLYTTRPVYAEHHALLQVSKTTDYAKCDEKPKGQLGVPYNAHILDDSTKSKILADMNNNTVYRVESTTKTRFKNGHKGVNIIHLNATLIYVEDGVGARLMLKDGRDAGTLHYAENNADRPIALRRRRSVIPSTRTENEENPQDGDLLSIYLNNDHTLYQTNDIVEDAVKLAIDIANLLKSSNELSENGGVVMFNFLTNLITEMTSSSLEQSTQKIWLMKNEEIHAWKIYIDALAEAGTIPAFRQLKNLILSGKIRGEEAAESVSSLPSTLRFPTEEIMLEFFEMANHPVVREEQHLNSSCLQATTRFINRAYINEESAKKYPSEIYGSFVSKSSKFIEKRIIPILKEKLEEAISKDDSRNAQDLIQAIGNLGHPAYVEILSKHLSNTSTFMRVHLVSSTTKLCRQHPSLARQVLFNIYQNSGENYEVRVAAVYQLMKAQPTRSMLERMALYTNENDSPHVRAAVKSMIMSLARLKHKDFQKNAKLAKAVIPLLTKENLGIQYSTIHLNDALFEDLNSGYFYSAKHIGSEDSIFPKLLEMRLRRYLGRWEGFNKVAASISSVSRLINKFSAIGGIKPPKLTSEGHYFQWVIKKFAQIFHVGGNNTKISEGDAEKIAQALGIQGTDERKLEGNILVKIMDNQRFFAFDENSLNQLIEVFGKSLSDLREGSSYNFTKIFNAESVTVLFPMAMGVPFSFRYKSPIYVHADGTSKLDWTTTERGALQGQIHAVFSQNIDGKIGFFNPLDRQFYISGVYRQFIVNIPIKYEIAADFTASSKIEVTLAPINTREDANIFNYKSNLYTTVQKVTERNAPHMSKNKLLIDEEQNTTERIVGTRGTGFGFRVKKSSPNQTYKNRKSPEYFEEYLERVMFKTVFPLLQREVNTAEYNVKYVAKESISKMAKFDLSIDNLQEKPTDKPNELDALYLASPVKPFGQDRTQEMLKTTNSGIRGATGQAISVHVKFGESEVKEYTATIARSSSSYDQKSKMWLHATCRPSRSVQHEVCAVVSTKSGNQPMMNFEKSLEHSPQADVDVKLVIGQNCQSGTQINAKVKLQQTEQRKKYIKEHPRTKQCLKQISENQHQRYACRSMIKKANTMDNMKTVIDIKNSRDTDKAMVRTVVETIRKLSRVIGDENVIDPKGQPGRINMEAQLYPDNHAMNISLSSENVDVDFSSVQLNSWIKSLLPVHPSPNWSKRNLNWLTQRQYTPACTLDNNMVNTFSNKTYSYELGNCWHVVMLNGSSANRSGQESSQRQLVILAREQTKDLKEVQVTYANEYGDNLNVKLQPSKAPEKSATGSNPSGIILVDGKQEMITDVRGFKKWGVFQDTTLLETFALPSGEVFVSIDDSTITLLYDGERLKIVASETYRNTTRGICGTMSGDQKKDYMTPRNCIMRSGAEFASTYAMVKDQECQGKAKEVQELASNSSCVSPMDIYSGIASPKSQANDLKPPRKSSSHDDAIQARSYKKENGTCALHKQVQYYEKHGQICISLRPIPACSTKCHGLQNEKNVVPVACKTSKDDQFRTLVKKLKDGEDFMINYSNVLGVTKKVEYFMVPTSCRV